MTTATDELVFTDDELVFLGEPVRCVNCTNPATNRLVFNCCGDWALKCDKCANRSVDSVNNRTHDVFCGNCKTVWPAFKPAEELLSVIPI